MYKLISLDLDGTLFNSESKVCQRNVDVIEACHKNGVETVVATGRPPRFTFDYIPKILCEDYCVCYNGAHIYYNEELIFEKSIDNQLVKDIIAYLNEKSPLIKVALESKDVIYCNFDMSTFWPNINYMPINELADFDHICKILIINCPSLDAVDLKVRFHKSCNVIQTDKGRLVEIMDKSVSKLEAIKWIVNKEALSIESVIAFGDDLNDLEILEGVGLGVAMGNGHLDVKAIANQTTLSNDDDGVAVFLEEILRL